MLILDILIIMMCKISLSSSLHLYVTCLNSFLSSELKSVLLGTISMSGSHLMEKKICPQLLLLPLK